MYKILVFGMTENPGGVESVIINYYRAINKNIFQFDFLCNSYEKIAYEDEIHALGGKTIHFPARSQNFFKYKVELEHFFKEHGNEYHAIWVNVCSLANIDYLKLAKKYGIQKRIIHSHNSQNMDSRLRGVLHLFNKRNIEQYATDFWACSSDAADWFFKPKLRERVVQIHNAIDISKWTVHIEKRNKYRNQLKWNDKFIIGNIGRLHYQKNQTFLLDIFKELEVLQPEARLILIGQGEDEVTLKEKVSQLGLNEKVYFAGVQYDIVGWLSMFDMFVFPSLFEGLPLVSLEAQANGITMLASEYAVPKDARINQNFVSFSLKKDAKDWAEKIVELKENVERTDKKRIQNNFSNTGYDINIEVRKLERLFLR